MKQSRKLWIALGAFAAFLLVSGLAYNALSARTAPESPLRADASSTAGQPKAGAEAEKTPAPDFTVKDGSGNDVKLSDLFGKPIVLNFWASWCPPCKSEMPHFEKVFQEMGDEVTFMMVDMVGGRETKASGQKYIAEQGFTFPVYYDEAQDAAGTYGISAIPTTIFIDTQGNLVAGAQSAIDEETLRYGISLAQDASAAQEEVSPVYQKISPEEAKAIMDGAQPYVLVDVRTRQEYDSGHIQGAVLIPDTQIRQEAARILPDKDAIILVYCRSGRRSEASAKELVALGYRNVYDFGGINDWPYGTVKP